MSGAHGWGGKDRRPYKPASSSGGGFSRARGAYNAPPSPPKTVTPAPSRAPTAHQALQAAVQTPDLDPRKEASTDAANVLIVALDTTASMGSWRKEIFDRLPLLYKEAQGYLGDDLQILFIAFGDSKFDDPFEVASFGGGPELDGYLEAMRKDSRGGGDEEESSELAAYYVLNRVKMPNVRHAYFYIVTDEKAAPNVSGRLAERVLGFASQETPSTPDLCKLLLRKMDVFIVLRRTDVGMYDPDAIKRFWVNAIGEERVVPLDDGRRVVDALLGVVAKTTGQLGQFTNSLIARQGGTKFGQVNIQTVHASLALVPGDGPSQPDLPDVSKPLLPSK